ncbi:MAG: flagellar hook-length control protein FliK [Alloalcanivorax venustensis]|uniref:flagellar hook-length control protein FliK n=2 Tax=Alloalcanivorax venustensis TaxID=172371 RepID=UPI0032996830
MDITALLSQNLAKTGATGQPAGADGEAFAGSLRNAAAKLLAASEQNGPADETTLALLDAGGDRQLSGEASDALRNALEALAGSRLKAGDGDTLPAPDTSLADLADAGVSGENAAREIVEHAANNGAVNPVTSGLAVPAPLTAAGSKSPAQDLPVMRAPDTLNRAPAVSALPADGAAGDTLSPAPAATGDAKPAMPAWATDAQALNGTLERSRLDTRLRANQESGAQNAGVMGTTGAASGQTGAAGAASPAAQFTLQAPVASAPWQQQLGQQMVGLAQRGDQHMELHLNPRELGPLSVSLKLDDQGAQAHFFSSHSTVRGAVEQAIPQLREALAEQGIALGEAMVGEHRQGFAGNGDGQPGQRGAAPASDGLAGEPAASEESVPVSRIIGGDNGGVDLYA